MDAFVKIVEQEGLLGLYSGLGSSITGTLASNFAYFYWYGLIRGAWAAKQGKQGISTVMELVLGALAGAMSQLMTLPLAVIATRQQTASRRERKDMMGTANDIVQHEGVAALWKGTFTECFTKTLGLKASLVLCSNPAITYGMFERMKSLLLERRPRKGNALSAMEVFLLGAISKSMATITTYVAAIALDKLQRLTSGRYPYIFAKVRLQWKPPKELADDPRYKYNGALDVLSKVYQSDGIPGWYKGMAQQLFKGIITQAILFQTKEQWSYVVVMLFNFLASLRGGMRESIAAQKEL